METSTCAPMTWDPRSYLDHHRFIIQRGKALADLLAPVSDERILEVGCGTGDVAAYMAERGARVVGIDLSEEMVQAARQRYPEQDFRQMDASQLPFDGEFDGVFSHAVLHWIREPRGVVQGIRRALRPGGRFVAEFGGYGNCARMEQHFAQALSREAGRIYHSPYYFPRLSEYAALLESNGFAVRQVAHFELPTRLEGEAGLRHWVGQFLAPHLAGLSETRANAVLGHMEDTLRPLAWADGAWLADYRRLRVFAEALAEH